MKNAMQWCKIHHEARTDPKLKILTLAERGVWTNLLLFASEQQQRGTIDASDRYVLALECADGDESTLNSTIEKLVRVRHLVPEDDESHLTFRTWNERQYEAPDGRPPPDEWRVLREAVFARDDYTCTYCGAHGVRLECDHIIPISRGGSNEMENLTTACKPCNQSKYNRTPGEWLQ